MIEKDQKAFLSLIRLGLGLTSARQEVFETKVNWAKIQVLAEKQGLFPIILDGIEQLPEERRPSQIELLQLIGEVLQGESIYASQWKVACDLSLLFHDNNIRTYILKGFVVSECYPIPSHRICVDLDSFLIPQQGEFDAWELGNQLMEQAGGEVDKSFYKNSTVMLSGLMVENHQFMTSIRGSKRLKKFERMLQSLIYEDNGENRFVGTYMFRPPVMVSSLFLIEHAYSHFIHEGITWRHILDWMMFSRKHKNDIDWDSLDALIDEFGFRKFYDSYTRLGGYLLGEIPEEELTKTDKKMLVDIWSDLDLHDFHGLKGKMDIVGNIIRATWKYHNFTPDLMITDLFRRINGFLFDRHPRIKNEK